VKDDQRGVVVRIDDWSGVAEGYLCAIVVNDCAEHLYLVHEEVQSMWQNSDLSGSVFASTACSCGLTGHNLIPNLGTATRP
jgi:hypothetical protein